jgi:nicotinic acid mononucleotide adenylyltransferase
MPTDYTVKNKEISQISKTYSNFQLVTQKYYMVHKIHTLFFVIGNDAIFKKVGFWKYCDKLLFIFILVLIHHLHF